MFTIVRKIKKIIDDGFEHIEQKYYTNALTTSTLSQLLYITTSS